MLKSDIVVGIDIGGTNTKIGLVNLEGKTLKEINLITTDYEEAQNFVDAVCLKIKEQVNHRENNFNLRGIGIGAPNGNFYNGTIEFAPNLRWKGIIPMVEMIKNHFTDIPVVLTNDANAAAYGEMIYGDARNLKHFILITLGTGLGSGIVVNGEMVYGHDGFAGELGHTTVFYNGRQCGCGRKGCLETYASATGIKRTVFELLANEMEESILKNYTFNHLTAKDIYEAAKAGDKIALKAFDFTADILAHKLADAVAITSPEAIFLFGGLTAAGDFLFKPLRVYFEQYLLPIYKNKIKILPSGLQNANIAILGSAALVIKENHIK
jgi:glucokinase